MNRLKLIVAGCALAGVAFGQGSKRDAFEAQDDPPAIVHWARGHAPDFASKGGGTPSKSSPLMTTHGGIILTATTVKAIFWGTSWATSAGDKITGLDAFYTGVGRSSYARTNIEYTGPNGQVSAAITYQGHANDDTAAPSGSPATGTILAEVCKVIGGSAIANGYYPVYVDNPRGTVGFCAWHTNGKCGQTPIEFGFFFKLDGDSGCNPQADVSVHSQGLAALVNVSGHELSETITDPQLNAWSDRQGEENADKCAWSFSTTAGTDNVTFGGSTWRIQGNWSNNAYNANTGYVRGCIDNQP